ncbi:MAG: acyltransferase family protein [Rufibacter sp.]
MHSLRGLASLAVFGKHVAMALFITIPWVLEVLNYGLLGVQAFFVISGFVLPYTLLHQQYRLAHFPGFLVKRLLRLEPPYLVAVILSAGYLVLGTKLPTQLPLPEPPSPMSLLLHAGYLIPFFKQFSWVNQVFWTLAVEFQYYLLLGLLMPLLGSTKLIQRCCFYALSLLPTLYIDRGLIILFLPLFLVGTLSALRFTKHIGKAEFFLVLGLASLVNLYKAGWAIEVTVVTLGVIGVIHLFPKLGGKVLTFFGDISYSLYLTHFATAMALNNLLWPHLTSPLQQGLVFLLSLLFGIGFAYLFYLLVERPAKRWASGFLRHKR